MDSAQIRLAGVLGLAILLALNLPGCTVPVGPRDDAPTDPVWLSVGEEDLAEHPEMGFLILLLALSQSKDSVLAQKAREELEDRGETLLWNTLRWAEEKVERVYGLRLSNVSDPVNARVTGDDSPYASCPSLFRVVSGVGFAVYAFGVCAGGQIEPLSEPSNLYPGYYSARGAFLVRMGAVLPYAQVGAFRMAIHYPRAGRLVALRTWGGPEPPSAFTER